MCNAIACANRMKRIASAASEADYGQAESDLRNSDEWQAQSSIHSWFENTWLSQKEVWIKIHTM